MLNPSIFQKMGSFGSLEWGSVGSEWRRSMMVEGEVLKIEATLGGMAEEVHSCQSCWTGTSLGLAFVEKFVAGPVKEKLIYYKSPKGYLK